MRLAHPRAKLASATNSRRIPAHPRLEIFSAHPARVQLAECGEERLCLGLELRRGFYGIAGSYRVQQRPRGAPEGFDVGRAVGGERLGRCGSGLCGFGFLACHGEPRGYISASATPIINVSRRIRLLYYMPGKCTARLFRRIRMETALTVCHLDLVQRPSAASRARPAPCFASQSSLPVLVPFFHLRLAVLWSDIAACRHDDFKARGRSSVQSLGIGLQGCPCSLASSCVGSRTSEVSL
jgi:hypothetical protein